MEAQEDDKPPTLKSKCDIHSVGIITSPACTLLASIRTYLSMLTLLKAVEDLI